MQCPFCKSKHVVKAGYKVLVGRKRARVQCQECGKTAYADDAVEKVKTGGRKGRK